MAQLVFKETQRFNQLWIWLLYAMLIVGVNIALINDLSAENIKWNEIIIVNSVFFLVAALLISLKLETRMDSYGISFRYPPIINNKRKYAWKDIQSVELVKYNSLLQFGGWGIRTNFNKWVYNTGGNQGIEVDTGKKKFIIGTRKAEEARKILELYKAELKSMNNA